MCGSVCFSLCVVLCVCVNMYVKPNQSTSTKPVFSTWHLRWICHLSAETTKRNASGTKAEQAQVHNCKVNEHIRCGTVIWSAKKIKENKRGWLGARPKFEKTGVFMK